jgi:hypothetical protein
MAGHDTASDPHEGAKSEGAFWLDTRTKGHVGGMSPAADYESFRPDPGFRKVFRW